MRSKLILAAVAALLVSAPLLHAQAAQPALQAFGGVSAERSSARVFYWNSQKNSSPGQFVVNYSAPAWSKEMDDPAAFDKATKGKIWRLGKDFWTTLDTNIPLTIAGKEVAPGSYYLGLERSSDGATWSLVFIDPAKARKNHADAFDMTLTPVEFKVPTTVQKGTAKNEKLVIDLSYAKETPKSVTMKISWGTMQVSVPIEAQVAM